jgi:hypothetical protein
MKLSIRVTYFPAIQIDIDYHFRPLMMCRHRYRINGRRLGTARPFPLWRLLSGPQSSSVDQYSETPPEHLESNLADAVGISAVTRNLLKNNLGREMKRARCGHHNNCRFNRRESNFLAHSADQCALATQLAPDQRTAHRRNRGGPNQRR